MLYSPESKGLSTAREAVAAYYRDHMGFAGRKGEIDPNNIVLTSGTSEGYAHLFRLLCDSGDEILVPAPSYPLFEFLADLADVRLVPYSLFYDHGWQIDLDGFEKALSKKSRAVLVVHPNNPTGSFVNEREADKLAKICGKREIAIVADEVFLDYGIPSRSGGEYRRPSFAFGTDALTFTLSGLSKIAALPQMKLAWLVASGPSAFVNAAVDRLDVIGDTFLSPGIPVQLALPRLLKAGADVRNQIRQRSSANLACLDRHIPSAGSIVRLEVEGGWYAVLKVPVRGTDEDLAVDLLEKHSVLMHPGHFFDFPGNGFLVLSLIGPESEFEEGVQRLLAYFGELGW